MGVAHQLAQHQQIDAGCGEVGPERVPQPMRANPGRPRPCPMDPEDLPESRLSDRTALSRAPENHEALRCRQALGSFPVEIATDLTEEGPVDRHDPLLGALARHLHQPHAHVHIGQTKRANLARPQPPEEHRQRHGPVAMRVQIPQEHLDITALEALGQRSILTHETGRCRRAP